MTNQLQKIWVWGASFDTQNMGINALADASLKCIFTHWPQAEVTLRTGKEEGSHVLMLNNKRFTVQKKSLWYGRNPFKPNNIYTLLGYAILSRLLPFNTVKAFLKARNPYFKTILEADLAVDITGGDSFSDIYGVRKFIHNSLPKWIFVLCRKKMVLLPQTYGPFYNHFSRFYAKRLLTHLMAIYSRDQAGLALINTLLGKAASNKIIKFMPDVAFVLDAEEPTTVEITQTLKQIKASGKILIGINISGLLYQDSRFGLKNNYHQLMCQLVEFFADYEQVNIVLVPHVYAQSECDPKANDLVYQQESSKYAHKLTVVKDELDHRQVKYLIGLCDFFLGARMHACIAALSQGVPAIGMAYSDKFQGVFASVGVENLVIDMRKEEVETILSQVRSAFNDRESLKQRLQKNVPIVQKTVLSLFNEIDK